MFQYIAFFFKLYFHIKIISISITGWLSIIMQKLMYCNVLKLRWDQINIIQPITGIVTSVLWPWLTIGQIINKLSEIKCIICQNLCQLISQNSESFLVREKFMQYIVCYNYESALWYFWTSANFKILKNITGSLHYVNVKINTYLKIKRPYISYIFNSVMISEPESLTKYKINEKKDLIQPFLECMFTNYD